MILDVGRIINSSIRSAIEGGTSGGLPHPSLITALCQQAGVEWAADEPLQQPKVLIDARMIRNYSQWDGAPADPKGAGFVLGAVSSDSDELDIDFDVPPPPPVDAEPSLHSLTTDVRRLQRESRRQTRRIDHVSQQMTSMMQYNASFNQTLVQMFARAGLNSGPDPLQFPTYPEPAVFPPDSPDSDA